MWLDDSQSLTGFASLKSYLQGASLCTAGNLAVACSTRGLQSSG